MNDKTLTFKICQKITKFFGYRIVKRSHFDDKLEALLKNPSFYFIQIGANDGVRFDNLYQKVTQHNISGIVIEPLERYYIRLKLNYEDYPHVIPLQTAIHPTEREVEIFHVDMKKSNDLQPWNGGIGSLNKSHLTRLNAPSEFILKTKVPAISIKDLIEKYNVVEIDLLQIDTEGFDFEVLKMIPYNLIKPKLIKYEYCNLKEDEKTLSIKLLQSEGYLTYIEGENAIGILNEHP